MSVDADLLIHICESSSDGNWVAVHHYHCPSAPAPGDAIMLYRNGVRVQYHVIARTWEPLELSTRVLVLVQRT